MAITLENVASPGVSPIGNNTASAAAFAANYFKLAVPNLSNRDRRTIFVLGMVYLVASLVDYRNNHHGLIQDAAVYTKGISQFDIFSAMGALIASAAHATDPTFSFDVPTLLKEGRDLDNLSEEELDRIITLLFAQLSI